MNLLLADLIRRQGGTRQYWRRALGEMRIYSLATHPHCNWDLRPSGRTADLAAVEEALDRLRAEHPHATAD